MIVLRRRNWRKSALSCSRLCHSFPVLGLPYAKPFCVVWFLQVLIYNGDEHAALAIGNCQLDQHNPARCGSGSQWGSNIVLKP